MIGTIEVRCSAYRPQMPLQPLFTFCGSPSSVRIRDVPKSIGDWSIDEVKLVVKYPDNSTIVKNAVRNGCVWVATIQGTDIAGKVSNGYEIVASGKDEDGNEVNGYVLGCGDVFVINRDVNATKDIEKFYVKWNDELPTNPAKGDLIYRNGNVRLFNGSEWLTLGLEPNVIEGIDNRINEVESSIPTKTSELENDSGFITAEDVPDNTKLFNDTKTKYIDGNGNIYEYFAEPKVKWVFSDGWKRELKEYSKDGVTFRYYFVGLYPYSLHPEVHIYSNESWKTDEERDAITQLTFDEFSDFEFPSVSATKVTMNGWSNIGVLADKDFVNSSIATNTANFWGTYISNVGWPTEATNNDYLFWKIVDENGNTIYKRYKYIALNSTWKYEYTLNNSSFTAQQWATINGGPYATQTSLNGKQDNLPYNDVWDVYDVGCWNAVNATRDVNGNDIDKTYATKEELSNAIGNVLT